MRCLTLGWILYERSQTSEMIRCHFPGSLGFKGELHVIDDEVDLDAARAVWAGQQVERSLLDNASPVNMA